MAGPLEGLRVLDLSRVLAGPYCTQMLGDMGAEIIKIEKPFSGDDTRFWGPPFDTNGESAYYLSVNRNKKSVAVDLAKPEGRNIILKLLATSDILIENFKVGSLARHRLGYNDLKDRLPGLIYCSITGFGQNGPLASEPGYDLVAQAMGGLMATTGEPDGAPMKAGVAVSDIITGLHAATAILAALHHRSVSGQGQHIDLSLLDCTLAAMTNLAQYYLTSGAPASRQGNAHASIAPYQAFQANDGWFVIAVGNDSQFYRLCNLLGANHIADDERFRTNSFRVLHKVELIAEISGHFLKQNVSDIVRACRDAGIPAGLVNSIDKAFYEPQVKARNMKVNMENVDFVGSPLKFSDTPVEYRLIPPPLGRDTLEVLSQAGYSDAALDELLSASIIQAV